MIFKILTSFAFCLLNVSSSHAFSRDYTFSITGWDLAEVNQVKNCIDYSVCRNSTSSFERAYAESTLKISLALNADELSLISKQCFGPYQTQFKILMLEPDREKSDRLFKEGMAGWEERPKESPVFLQLKSRAEVAADLDTLEALSKGKKYDEAIAFATSAFGLDFSGYQVSYTNESSAKEFAVTTHETQTIKVGKFFFKDRCSLMVGLRHEAEHAFQMKQESACQSQNKSSAYRDHLARERSAYMNDIINVRRFCDSLAEKNHEVTVRYQLFEKKYGNSAVSD